MGKQHSSQSHRRKNVRNRLRRAHGNYVVFAWYSDTDEECICSCSSTEREHCRWSALKGQVQTNTNKSKNSHRVSHLFSFNRFDLSFSLSLPVPLRFSLEFHFTTPLRHSPLACFIHNDFHVHFISAGLSFSIYFNFSLSLLRPFAAVCTLP